MKRPLRRRRFFALGEERALVIVPDEHRVTTPASPTTHSPLDGGAEEIATDDEIFSDGDAGASETADESLPPGFSLSRPPRARVPKRRGLPGWSITILALTCLGLGIWLGTFFPKATPNESPDAGAGGARVIKLFTSAEQEEMDSAFIARAARRFPEATEKFKAMGQAHPDWKWVETEKIRTLLYGGKVVEARLALLGAVDKATQPADANYLLGVAYLVEKAFESAEEKFARAVALDPTRPEYYYFWGDCLRTEGKPLEAAAKFRAALLRNSLETADGFYRLKLWLCEIEADQEEQDGLSKGLDSALATSHPPMEALGAAAARSIKHGDFQTAKSILLRLQQVTSSVIFHVILDDPSFRQFQSQPELTHFFQPIPVEADAGVSPAGLPAAPASPAAAADGSPTPRVAPSKGE